MPDPNDNRGNFDGDAEIDAESQYPTGPGGSGGGNELESGNGRGGGPGGPGNGGYAAGDRGEPGGRDYVPMRRAPGPPAWHTDSSLGYPGSPYGPMAGDGGEDSHLWDYLRVIWQRRWTVAAVFTFCVLSAVVLTMAATPLYRSSSLLQIQPGGPNVVGYDEVQESVQVAQAYNDFFQTQYDLLSSRRLARRTIERLELDQDPWLNGDTKRASPLGRAKQLVKMQILGAPDPEVEALEREKELLDNFADSVTIRPRRKSFLVEVGFSSPDPRRAAEVAGVLATEYVDLTLDQRIEAATQGRNFIVKQLEITKARLEQSEQEMHEFAKGRDIYALDQEEKVIHERLADLNSKLTEVESDRIRLEALYRQATGPARDRLSQIAGNPLVAKLKEDLSKARAERAELGGRFTEEYPPMRVLDSRIAELKKAIDAEIGAQAASIRADYRTALDREALIRFQLERQRKIVADYEDKAIDFKIMRREVETNRGIYETLLRRMKEVEVTEAIRSSNITLVDEPEVPLEAASPDLPLNLALSMMLGLVAGVGLALFQEYMDDSINTPEDVERLLRLPALGAVPEFLVAKGSASDGQPTPDLEVALQPTSAGAESIRTLRASLFLAAAGGLPSRLLVTSAKPGEGKTCIAANLAAALAQMGRRVAIMDCDLRRPRVHSALSTEQSPGITNFLTGNVDLATIIHRSGQAGLDVLPAGPIPPNPVDLLDSARMAELIRDLEERYDHVIVDAPPALGFADVPVLSNRLGGGCLLVTRAGDTPRRIAREACEYLFRMQSKMLGVVLNRVASRSGRYSYYSYYSYYGQESHDRLSDRSRDRLGGEETERAKSAA